jgi:hypothetical protein
MFEYLMPDWCCGAPGGSLLAQTSRLIVKRQVAYGEELGMPWGVSESAYNARDLELTYQYSNFGVPGPGTEARPVGEQGGGARTPRASPAMVDGEAALANYRALDRIGARGRYWLLRGRGLHARARVPEGARCVQVRCYMAHHQGMSIVAIANALNDGRMRQRFHSDASVQATELLLQERTPRDVSVAHPRAEEVGTAARTTDPQVPDVRRVTSPHDSAPQTHLLSNGRYSVMISAAGSGYSRWNDLAVTRWREDPTRDDTGSYFLLRDVDTGRVWSAGYQPCAVQPTFYEVSFTEDRAEIIRSDGEIVTMLEVQVILGGRRRSAPRVDQQLLRPPARHRSHFVPGAGARRPGRGHRASRVLEAVRTHRVPAAPGRAAGKPAPPCAGRTRALVFASRRDRGRDHGRTGVRNRPNAIHRPQPGLRAPLGHARGPYADGLAGHGARCGIRTALHGVRACWWNGAHRVLDLRGAGPLAGAGAR